MFEGFSRERVDNGEAEISLVRGGSGPPVLLLHGYPQTHVMWHLVAPRLAERFTVVAPDLRGYGDSSKPPSDPEHLAYSKRAMAADQVELMADLGFERFAVVGHDRGGRVTHRLALDHPGRVTRAAVLDIVPTYAVFRSTNKELALSTYHWFFLSQPFGLAERLIGGDPSFFLHWHLRAWSGGRDDFFSPQALAEYERCFRDAACIHATCEDYRAGASIDLEHDQADPMTSWPARSSSSGARGGSTGTSTCSPYGASARPTSGAALSRAATSLRRSCRRKPPRSSSRSSPEAA